MRVRVAASRRDKALKACPGAGLVYGQCRRDDWHPDLDWLEQQLQGPDPPKMVTIVNPCNPTGDFLGCGLLLISLSLHRVQGLPVPLP